MKILFQAEYLTCLPLLWLKLVHWSVLCNQPDETNLSKKIKGKKIPLYFVPKYSHTKFYQNTIIHFSFLNHYKHASTSRTFQKKQANFLRYHGFCASVLHLPYTSFGSL